MFSFWKLVADDLQDRKDSKKSFTSSKTSGITNLHRLPPPHCMCSASFNNSLPDKHPENCQKHGTDRTHCEDCECQVSSALFLNEINETYSDCSHLILEALDNIYEESCEVPKKKLRSKCKKSLCKKSNTSCEY